MELEQVFRSRIILVPWVHEDANLGYFCILLVADVPGHTEYLNVTCILTVCGWESHILLQASWLIISVYWTGSNQAAVAATVQGSPAFWAGGCRPVGGGI